VLTESSIPPRDERVTTHYVIHSREQILTSEFSFVIIFVSIIIRNQND
jgi:hypothetical protein